MKYVRNKDFVFAKMGNEIVTMDVTVGKYYNLGEIGGLIWQYMDAPITEDEMVSTLLGLYQVDEKECREDVHQFITELIGKGLVNVVDE